MNFKLTIVAEHAQTCLPDIFFKRDAVVIVMLCLAPFHAPERWHTLKDSSGYPKEISLNTARIYVNSLNRGRSEVSRIVSRTFRVFKNLVCTVV